MAKSLPMDGRAMFVEVAAKGVKKEAAAVTMRAVRLLMGGFIFPSWRIFCVWKRLPPALDS